MKAFLLIPAFALAATAQTPPAAAAPLSAAIQTNPDEIVLTVGDRTFTASQYEQLVRALLPQAQQPYALGPAKRDFSKRMVELLILSGEAQKQHLDQQPGVMLQLELQRNVRLSAETFQKLQSELPVTDAQVQAYYDSNKGVYEVIKVRQILVRVKGSQLPGKPGKPELSDSEAQTKAASIRKRILEGEDFAKVATEESDDPSASKGGDIGEIAHGMTPPQFEQSAFGLKDGDLSDPVRTPFGYHIIQVQSRSVKPLSDVKEDVTARVRQALAPAAVQDLVKKAGYQIDDKFFGPDPDAPPPVAAPPAPR